MILGALENENGYRSDGRIEAKWLVERKLDRCKEAFTGEQREGMSELEPLYQGKKQRRWLKSKKFLISVSVWERGRAMR